MFFESPQIFIFLMTFSHQKKQGFRFCHDLTKNLKNVISAIKIDFLVKMTPNVGGGKSSEIGQTFENCQKNENRTKT